MSSPAARRNNARLTGNRAMLIRIAEEAETFGCRTKNGTKIDAAECGCHHLITISRNGYTQRICLEHGEAS